MTIANATYICANNSIVRANMERSAVELRPMYEEAFYQVEPWPLPSSLHEFRNEERKVDRLTSYITVIENKSAH